MAQRDSAKLVAHVAAKRSATAQRSSSAAFDKRSSSKFAAAGGASSDRLFPETAAPVATGSAHHARFSQSHLLASKRSKFSLEETATPYASAASGGLLGSTIRHDTADGEGDANDPFDPKRARREKFEEVITQSRQRRAAAKRVRDETETQTDAIDKEFTSIHALLQRRDFREEAVEKFHAATRPEIRDLLAKHPRPSTGRVFSLGDSGELSKVVSGEEAGAPTLPAAIAAALPDEALAIASKYGVTSFAAATAPKPVVKSTTADVESTAASGGGSVDAAFEALMASMKGDHRRAHAGERTLTDAEVEKRKIAQELQQLERSQGDGQGADSRGVKEMTRAEWIEAGGDGAAQMDSDHEIDVDDDDASAEDEEGENDAGYGAVAPAKGLAFDASIGEVEKLVASLEAGTTTEPEAFLALQALATRVWTAAKASPRHAIDVYRALLVDMQRRGQQRMEAGKPPMTQLHLALAFVATRVFPMSDLRHPVTSPLTLLLSSFVSQAPLSSVAHASGMLRMTGLLWDIVSAKGAFAAEPIAAALAVLGLAVSRRALEANAVSLPATLQGTRPAEALSWKAQSSAEPIASCQFLTSSGTPEDVRVCLATALRMLLAMVAQCNAGAAFPYAFEAPYARALAPLLDAAFKDDRVLLALHKEVSAAIAAKTAAAVEQRAPLAMRTFRPRPLRLYEPLLEVQDPRAVHERRALKREVSDTKKRLVRHIQAEAAVERREKERVETAENARRTQNLNSLMAELQQQQHTMKTVDKFMLKSKEKKKKKISGDPSQDEGEGDDQGGRAKKRSKE